MRTLLEIIESIKDGEEPTREELYYSVLALEALSSFDHMDFRRLLKKPDSRFFTIEWLNNEVFNRSKNAYRKSPKDWVGWDNDPHNPDYQGMRVMHKRLFDKIIAKHEANKGSD